MIVLAAAVRSGYAFGHAGDPNPTPFSMAAGSPRGFSVSFPSVPWSTLANEDTLTMAYHVERSIDDGATWQMYFFNEGARNLMGKGGVIPATSTLVSWDGKAMLIRGDCVAGPAPFSFAIDIT